MTAGRQLRDRPPARGRRDSRPLTAGRLKSRRQFLKVAAARCKWVTPGLVLQARAVTKDEMDITADLRVGFTVTRKVGGAVTRNRVRRRLKAAAHQVMPEWGRSGIDYVLIGRKGTISRPFELLLEDLETALRRIKIGRKAER
ncbi:MAG: ribonuclease P protein component [Sphingomonadales bacterium]